MKKILQFLIITVTVLSSYYAVAMNDTRTIYNLIVVPAVNGDGGKFVKDIFPESKYAIHTLGAPMGTWPWLNERNYAQVVAQRVRELKKVSSICRNFIYVSGDAVSGVLDFAANNPDNIVGIMIEGTTLLDNYYTFSDISKISKTIPIIMIHHDNDKISPCADIKALYHHAKAKNAFAKIHCLSLYNVLAATDTQSFHIDLLNPINCLNVIQQVNYLLISHYLPNQSEAIRQEMVKQNNSGSNKHLKVTWHDLSGAASADEIKHMNSLVYNENKRFYSYLALKCGISLGFLMFVLYSFNVISKFSSYYS